MENKIKIFENKQVRTAWNADEEEWCSVDGKGKEHWGLR